MVVTDEFAVMLVELFGFAGWVVAVEEMLGTYMVLLWFISVGRVVLMLDVDGSVVMLVGYAEHSVLQKGLLFIPTPYTPMKDIKEDMLDFSRSLRLTYLFQHKQESFKHLGSLAWPGAFLGLGGNSSRLGHSRSTKLLNTSSPPTDI